MAFINTDGVLNIDNAIGAIPGPLAVQGNVGIGTASPTWKLSVNANTWGVDSNGITHQASTAPTCTSSASDCAVGFLCLNNGATSGTCKKRCNTTDATTCPAGLTCGTITIGSPPVLVGENFGVCDKP